MASASINSHEVSFGGLFEGNNHYIMPDFQRDYSWTEDEVDTLWKDIVRTVEDGDDQHFMGAIVLEESTGSSFIVIDGQQRLATISLLTCVLRHVAFERDDKQLSQVIADSYLGFLNLRTREMQPKLTLNSKNDSCYQSVVTSESIPRNVLEQKRPTIEKSNRLLLEAYEYLLQQINTRISDFEKKGIGFQDVLVELEECVRDKLIIIRIIVNDRANAYLIFETLNDRGLELSVADLLKNYLFSKAAKPKFDGIKYTWEQISLTLGNIDVTSFIRHFWMSYQGVIRGRNLYGAITSKYRTEGQVYTFITELKNSAEVYAAFADPQSALWDWYDPSDKTTIVKNVELLNLFKVTQCYPVLLAMFDEVPTDFPDVLHMMVIFSFRYSIICGFGTGKIETAYADTAKFIRNKDNDRTPKTIFEQLSKLYPQDEIFERYFSEKTITSSQLARYILSEINNSYSREAVMVVNPDTSVANLEHIMPKKRGDGWQHISEVDHKEYLYRIGNMTILGSGDNRRLGNKPFSDKRTLVYEHSDVEITKKLAAYKEWDIDEIINRQVAMASAACSIWRLNY